MQCWRGSHGIGSHLVGVANAVVVCGVPAARAPHTSLRFGQASGAIGGQFNMAKRIPGKEEFQEALDYYERMLAVTGVKVVPPRAASCRVVPRRVCGARRSTVPCGCGCGCWCGVPWCALLPTGKGPDVLHTGKCKTCGP